MRLIDADTIKREVKHRCVLSPLDAPWPLAYGNIDLPEIIDQMPTIEAEPVKHGRWEKNGEIMMFGDIPVKCSQCGFKTLQDALHKMDYHYCPNCGARMDEVEDG